MVGGVVESMKQDYARAYIDKLWAEVMEIYKGGDFRLKLSKEMEEQVRIRQKDFLPEDTDAGMILAFMRDTQETKVCSRMLFMEALSNEYVQPTRSQTNEICDIVNQLIRDGVLKGWRAYTSPKRFRNGYTEIKNAVTAWNVGEHYGHRVSHDGINLFYQSTGSGYLNHSRQKRE